MVFCCRIKLLLVLVLPPALFNEHWVDLDPQTLLVQELRVSLHKVECLPNCFSHLLFQQFMLFYCVSSIMEQFHSNNSTCMCAFWIVMHKTITFWHETHTVKSFNEISSISTDCFAVLIYSIFAIYSDFTDGMFQTPRFVRDNSQYWHKPNLTRDEGECLLKLYFILLWVNVCFR